MATNCEVVVHEYHSDEELAANVLFQDYPVALLYFAFAYSVLFALIGIPGNLTTVIALARHKKVRNATAIFIINLHISDLIFCCLILPVNALTYWQKHWSHGWYMCRVYPFFKYVLNLVAIFSIVAISINRYVIVCHPLWYPKLYKRRNITIMLIILWMSSFAIFLPTTLGIWGRLDLDPHEGFCTMVKDRTKHNHSPNILFLIIAFIGPYVTIIFCYARVWWVVRKNAIKSKSQITRPTHLPVSHTQSDPSNDGNKVISNKPLICQNSMTEDVNSRNDTAASSRCQIARPTHLPLLHSQLGPSSDGDKVISGEPLTCQNSITVDDNSGSTTSTSFKNQIAKPTHLPLSYSQLDPSNEGNKGISGEPLTCQINITENDNPRNDIAASSKGQIARPTHFKLSNCQSASQNYENIHNGVEASNTTDISTPSEHKIVEKFFTAPFRKTKKELRSKSLMRREKKLCTMIAVIMVSLCIWRLPIIMTRILYEGYRQNQAANVFAHFFEYLGNCMNPIIYVIMSSEYRQAYKNLLDSVMKKLRGN